MGLPLSELGNELPVVRLLVHLLGVLGVLAGRLQGLRGQLAGERAVHSQGLPVLGGLAGLDVVHHGAPRRADNHHLRVDAALHGAPDRLELLEEAGRLDEHRRRRAHGARALLDGLQQLDGEAELPRGGLDAGAVDVELEASPLHLAELVDHAALGHLGFGDGVERPADRRAAAVHLALAEQPEAAVGGRARVHHEMRRAAQHPVELLAEALVGVRPVRLVREGASRGAERLGELQRDVRERLQSHRYDGLRRGVLV
mmetsp:Transcript_45657/g.120668  ORF Transcript_45657/g.120668 Transcript_45657/m.120668 type:complete len:257 (+) Transcript_45657:331-1101(+)